VALPGDVDLHDGMTVTVIPTEVLNSRNEAEAMVSGTKWLPAALCIASTAMAAAR